MVRKISFFRFGRYSILFRTSPVSLASFFLIISLRSLGVCARAE